MARCEVCGNVHNKTFTFTLNGRQHTFDSFQCAIQALTPPCCHCSGKIVGHGVKEAGSVYCCAHCATRAGAVGLVDRADTPMDTVEEPIPVPATGI